MKPLNYTTEVPVSKTCGEIISCLSEHGAQQILTEYDQGAMVAVSFRIVTPYGVLSYRLPSRVDAVLKVLRNSRGVAPRYQTPEQAQRVAWRVVKDWLEAQLALVRFQVAELPQVFLPYQQAPDGRTLFETLKSTGTLALPESA